LLVAVHPAIDRRTGDPKPRDPVSSDLRDGASKFYSRVGTRQIGGRNDHRHVRLIRDFEEHRTDAHEERDDAELHET
jgi:hypothetical protein